ncbi:hypothetical protein J5O04_01345 [Corynebacterium hindlerae]|uniref:hypothetical protein n=1 Tax=Corynebacterium hindlerae TaxID=699041 RepID=UPI001AD6AF6C|nr:hypothetical protein [Corynebacterium hindlerae]QTH59817.1 hypothetical protein J5O04_01345 [Corynebacterium hindlerae]
MDAEETLLLADAVCAETGASVRSLGAIVALASLTRPHIAGISVFSSPQAQCDYISSCCSALQPLTSSNEVFAHVLCAAVTERL